MDKQIQADKNRLGGLTAQIARKAEVSQSELLMFNDFTAATTALFANHATSHNRVLVVGHATPNLQIAIDRAGLEMVEMPGESVFAGTPETALQKIASDNEIIYVANPNRVSGASLSYKDLEKLASSIPRGLLVVDEHYHEFYRITGVPLTKEHDGVVVIRSFAAGFSIGSEVGYIVGGRQRLERLGANQPWQRMSRTLDRIVSMTLANEVIQAQRLTMIHDESLRLSTALTRAGIQNRLTPCDFILLRVANPAKVCNYMAAHKMRLENLDGYPQMRKFLKYTVQSQESNDRFLQAVSGMPREHYHLDGPDRLVQKLRRPPENGEDQVVESVGVKNGSTKKKLASREEMTLIGSK